MVRKTLKIKLGILTQEKQETLANALAWSNEIAQFYVDIFKNSYTKDKTKIHGETYQFLRTKFPNLNSKCIQWIRDKCIASFRPEKTQSIRVPIMTDAQSFKVFWDKDVQIKHFKGILRLWRKDYPLVLSEWHIKQMNECKRFAYIELRQRKDKQWFLHLVGDYEEQPKATSDKYLGVDCGINNIAVTSTGKFFSGKRVLHKRNEFRKHKRQQSGIRLQNYVRDINHKISKALVQEAINQGVSVIRLERLKYIRENRESQGKVLNYRVHNWAFRQLQEFVVYKAQLAGIGTEFIQPAYTSQTCSVCGSIGHREIHEFSCTSCGYRCHADLNASKNICRDMVFANGVLESTLPTDAKV